MNGKLDNLDIENVRERRSAGRLIGKIGGWAALAAALIAAGLAVYISVCSARGVPAKLFGRSFARVMTGSMSPSISEGDYIIIKSGDLNELKKGDIITFYSEDPAIYGKLNTHRIIGVAQDGSYITKGDANAEADPVTVKRSKIVGKYAQIALSAVGKLVRFGQKAYNDRGGDTDAGGRDIRSGDHRADNAREPRGARACGG